MPEDTKSIIYIYSYETRVSNCSIRTVLDDAKSIVGFIRLKKYFFIETFRNLIMIYIL